MTIFRLKEISLMRAVSPHLLFATGVNFTSRRPQSSTLRMNHTARELAVVKTTQSHESAEWESFFLFVGVFNFLGCGIISRWEFFHLQIRLGTHLIQRTVTHHPLCFSISHLYIQHGTVQTIVCSSLFGCFIFPLSMISLLLPTSCPTCTTPQFNFETEPRIVHAFL